MEGLFQNMIIVNFGRAYNFKDFGITGEAYLSVGKDLNYFSDTGRTWAFGSNLRDYIPGKTERIFADTTDELIELIKEQ